MNPIRGLGTARAIGKMKYTGGIQLYSATDYSFQLYFLFLTLLNRLGERGAFVRLFVHVLAGKKFFSECL